MRKPLRITAGVALVLIGIVGLILPVMPGWVFIIPGLVILGEYSPRIQRLVHWAKAKYECAVHRAQPTRDGKGANVTSEQTRIF
jgi:uncharacterized membrane protein YbaN (DUF454 family)